MEHSKESFLAAALVAFATTASSAPPPASIAVSVTGEGVVISAPAGISCPDDCSEDYRKSTVIALTAAPGSGQSFVGWGGACAGTSMECTVKLSTPLTTVTAEFTATAPPPPAPLAQTGAARCAASDGQEIPCAGTGQDGEFRAGITWPSPRFIDNGDGTVSDGLTGLIWTQNVCGSSAWDEAAAAVAVLANGSCDLSDGSAAGDWRLPNAIEALSLIDWGTGSFAECPFLYGLPDCDVPLLTSTPSSEPSEFGLAFYAVFPGSAVSLPRWPRGSVLPFLAVKVE